MQNAILFQATNFLPVSGYVPGQAQWEVAVRLTGVRGLWTGGQSVTFQLEIDGVVTGDLFVSDGSNPGQVQSLDQTVSAGSVVRWRCSFAGAATESPSGVQLQLEWEPSVASVNPVMQLEWRESGAVLPMFSYDPDTTSFQDISNGLASGRLALDFTNGLSIFLDGLEVLRCRDGYAAAINWLEGAWPVVGEPGVYFMVNAVPWLVITANGVYAGSVIETNVWPADVNYFDLGTARVTLNGFYAQEIREGLP